MRLIDIFLKFFRTKKVEDFKQQKQMDNVVASMFLCEPLYDKLKVKCHPDKFSNNSQKQEKANELFQELQKNRYNFEKMKELETIIEANLH